MLDHYDSSPYSDQSSTPLSWHHPPRRQNHVQSIPGSSPSDHRSECGSGNQVYLNKAIRLITLETRHQTPSCQSYSSTETNANVSPSISIHYPSPFSFPSRFNRFLRGPGRIPPPNSPNTPRLIGTESSLVGLNTTKALTPSLSCGAAYQRSSSFSEERLIFSYPTSKHIVVPSSVDFVLSPPDDLYGGIQSDPESSSIESTDDDDEPPSPSPSPRKISAGTRFTFGFPTATTVKVDEDNTRSSEMQMKAMKGDHVNVDGVLDQIAMEIGKTITLSYEIKNFKWEERYSNGEIWSTTKVSFTCKL